MILKLNMVYKCSLENISFSSHLYVVRFGYDSIKPDHLYLASSLKLRLELGISRRKYYRFFIINKKWIITYITYVCCCFFLNDVLNRKLVFIFNIFFSINSVIHYHRCINHFNISFCIARWTYPTHTWNLNFLKLKQ